MNESRVSPWVRPVLLFSVGFVTAGVALICGVLDGFFPGLGLRVGTTIMELLGKVPTSWVDLFETMFVAYAIAKTGERGVKAYTEAKAAPHIIGDQSPE